jgi:nicotinamide-nucleotide amidase
MRLEQKVAEHLINQKKTLSIAESCSGGLLGHRLTNIPGSSKFFHGGILAYHNNVKISILKVPSRMLLQHGAVSSQVALLMAKHVRTLFKTDFGVAITGIAGPTSATKNKPVGLVFIAVSTKKSSICLKYCFKSTRFQIKTKATTQALKMLIKITS